MPPVLINIGTVHLALVTASLAFTREPGWELALCLFFAALSTGMFGLSAYGLRKEVDGHLRPEHIYCCYALGVVVQAMLGFFHGGVGLLSFCGVANLAPLFGCIALWFLNLVVGQESKP